MHLCLQASLRQAQALLHDKHQLLQRAHVLHAWRQAAATPVSACQRTWLLKQRRALRLAAAAWQGWRRVSMGNRLRRLRQATAALHHAQSLGCRALVALVAHARKAAAIKARVLGGDERLAGWFAGSGTGPGGTGCSCMVWSARGHVCRGRRACTAAASKMCIKGEFCAFPFL